MDRVFLKDFILEGNDYKHLIRVRRLNENDLIEAVINEELYLCKIKLVLKDSAILEVIQKLDVISNLPKIILFQSILEKKKMEIVFKICTALGVSEFVPVITKRIEANKIKNFDVDRNKEIIKEAAQQSKGVFLPKINPILKFEEAILESKKYDLSMILYENEGKNYIKDIDFNNITIGLFVGPEGGFTKNEIDFACENGVKSIKLFSRILRSELAAFSALSIINSNVEEYESKNKNTGM